MPFTPYKNVLSPFYLADALEAFDLGWAEIIAAGGGYDMQLARDLLAKRIVEAAMRGESDPARLKAYALTGFGRPNPTNSELSPIHEQDAGQTEKR